MRILFLSTWFPYPPDNGSKIRVYHLLRALGAAHQVTCVAFAFGTANPDETGDLQRFCAQVLTVPHDPFDRNHLARALRFFSPAPIVARPLPEMTRAVGRVVAQTAFDIVIASTGVMAAYAPMATRAARVLEEHNSMTRWMWERYQAQASTLRRLRCWTSWQKTRFYESHLFREFDLCVMVSEQDRQASRQMLLGYDGRVEVVPNGVDCQHNRPGLGWPVPNRLVFNGALTYSVNYDAMYYFSAQVYPLIRQQIPDVELYITGSTAGVDLAGLRLDESVRLTNYVEDIRPWIAGASVCVVPLRQGGGTRLKILEAMALGVPVISTSKGAEGLDVVDGEHILLADSPEAFADQTVRSLHDPELRQRLATNARRLVEQCYDWTPIGQRFVALVEDIAGSPVRGGKRS